jgi:hypothetical protein
MTTDSASLDNLRPLGLPDAVSWFPPQPGWWILLGMLLAFAALGLWRLAQAYRANAYRRLALAELQTLAQQQNIAAPLVTLLKRTALSAYPRSEVAGLTGPAWQDFLARTGAKIPAPLWHAALNQQPLAPADATAALQAARLWISQHRRPNP